MKASFWKRLAAYIIDIMIVSIIVTIVCLAIPKKESKVEEKLDELSNQLVAGEITSIEYIEKYENLLYEDQKNNIIENTVNIVLILAYFVVFQYMNKGQTLGKKLLHIKVVDKNNNSPVKIYKGLLRSLFILNIISGLIAVILINFTGKNTYMNIYMTITEIEALLIFVSAIFILYRKDGRGLHDLIANTMVIEEERS